MSVARRITPRIVRKVAATASTANNRMHVLPREGKWVVRKDGSSRVTGVYISREAALKVAKKVNQRDCGPYTFGVYSYSFGMD